MAFVEVREVSKRFGGVEVLRSVSLDVGKGEVICIIGPSGGGKTTLLRIINHLEALSGGTVRVDGELIGYRFDRRGHQAELNDKAAARQRAQIGMVFQRFNLFAHKTAMGNVMAGPMVVKGIARKDAERRAMELLDAVGVADRAGYYPHQLSGGQQQRVAIARALAMDPKVMLFDEPTSALDIELVGEVLEAMKLLARAGMTMIVVTHEVSFARDVADRVLMMDRGAIIEDAAPNVFFGTPRHDRTKAFLSKIVEA